MEIIIDGYNLLASDRGLSGTLEPRRQRLIQQLALYQKNKGFAITVVFDGWKEGRFEETAERASGVKVIFSRRDEKADAVVLRLARQSGSGCVVVSSDREIRSAVEKIGATAVYAGEFSEILRRLDAPGMPEDELQYESVDSTSNVRLPKAERRRREKLRKLALR
jgi:predicted RNA-binding protein with PIN domain